MTNSFQDFIRKFIPPKEETKKKTEEEVATFPEMTIEKQKNDLLEKSEKSFQLSSNCSNIVYVFIKIVWTIYKIK